MLTMETSLDAKEGEWLPRPIHILKPLSGGIAESGQSDQLHIMPANKADLPVGTVKGRGIRLPTFRRVAASIVVPCSPYL
ncbi:MAG: hypothetical protein WCJ35_02360 [Planctomycetota bacterium]